MTEAVAPTGDEIIVGMDGHLYVLSDG